MGTRTFSLVVSSPVKKVVLSLLLLFFLAVLCFSAFYIMSGYNGLVGWYMNLGGCFYGQEEWTTQFFTPAVKKAGNLFAIAGNIIALVGIVVVLMKWKSAESSKHSFSVNAGRLPWYCAVIILGGVAAAWEWNRMAPAYDEVFSVVNCAEVHPFRTISYYMLPNNHVYFNLLNSVLFGWWGDLVASGRLLSLLAYLGVLVSIYHLFARMISSNLMAFIALLPVALQFHSWAFASQARGYELQLLCGWMALISLRAYLVRKSSPVLLLNTIANISGFLLIPSYLYFYLPQLLCMGIAAGRKRDLLKHQIVLGSMVFLCYLPALCFSGIAAFSDNRWVKPGTDTLGEYLPKFASAFLMYVRDGFCNIGGTGSGINYVVFLLPLVLLLTKRREHKQFVAFYFALWAMFALYSLGIKKTPFHRTLIIHYSVTVAACSYSFYVIVDLLSGMIGNRIVRALALALLFVLPVCGYSYYLIKVNRDNLTWMAYGYDVNSVYANQLDKTKQIPARSSVSFSDDAFYSFYLCRDLGYKANRCVREPAPYFIKIVDRPFPAGIENQFEQVGDAGNDFAIYKRQP